jgi:hypothetical protein
VYHVNELQRIQDQIGRSLDGEAWHGPALMEVLSGVNARAAIARPIPNAHTIWEILLHVSASTELVLARLRGKARTLSPGTFPAQIKPSCRQARQGFAKQRDRKPAGMGIRAVCQTGGQPVLEDAYEAETTVA